jgi:transcriptional regulator with XRE-family HTH domain
MNLLKDRITELRKENNLTKKKLAEVIGTTDDSVYSWEKGRAEPSVDFIIKLSDFFNVSTDYLLGRKD